MFAQHAWESIKGDSTAKVVHMMHTDIGREPAQNARQLIMGATMKRCLVQVPARSVSPKRLLELMLNVEEPNANGRRQKRNRQMHKQEWLHAHEPHHRKDDQSDGCVGYHRAEPRPQAAPHQS